MDANEGERPYQLLLIADPDLPNQQISGAVLIQNTWTLTAAHCVTEPRNGETILVSEVSIQGGSVNRIDSTNMQTQVFSTKGNVFYHKLWDWTEWSGYG